MRLRLGGIILPATIRAAAIPVFYDSYLIVFPTLGRALTLLTITFLRSAFIRSKNSLDTLSKGWAGRWVFAAANAKSRQAFEFKSEGILFPFPCSRHCLCNEIRVLLFGLLYFRFELIGRRLAPRNGTSFECLTF